MFTITISAQPIRQTLASYNGIADNCQLETWCLVSFSCPLHFPCLLQRMKTKTRIFFYLRFRYILDLGTWHSGLALRMSCFRICPDIALLLPRGLSFIRCAYLCRKGSEKLWSLAGVLMAFKSTLCMQLSKYTTVENLQLVNFDLRWNQKVLITYSAILLIIPFQAHFTSW